jgi:hypothetical protein
VSEGVAGGLIIVIWQAHHKGMSVSRWHPGTSVAGDARRLDWAKSLPGSPNPYPGLGSDRLAVLLGGSTAILKAGGTLAVHSGFPNAVELLII